MPTVETLSQYTARKARERANNELQSTSTPSELIGVDRLRLGQGRPGTGTGDLIRTAYGRYQLAQDQEESGGFFDPFRNRDLKGIASRLTSPLIDVPDLPGPLNLIEEGIEELSSPIGLASAALIPFTGGTSLGLRGAAGLGAQVASRASAEVVVGGLAVGASSFVNDKLPDNTPPVLRLIASLGAGVGAAGASSRAFSTSFAGQDVDNIVRGIRGSDAARKLGRALNETPDLIKKNLDDLSTFRGQQLGRFEKELGTAPFDQTTFRNARRAMRGQAKRSGDAALNTPAWRERLAGQLTEAGGTSRLDDDIRGAVAIRNGFNKADVRDLYGDLSQAYAAKTISTTELIGAESGLVKILNGVVPQQNEWEKLALVFGPSLERSFTQGSKSAARKALDITLDLANTPRALAASSDMSAPLRQGALLIGHPKEFAESFGTMVKSFFNEDFADQVQEGLTSGVRARRLRAAGVQITDYRPGSLTGHEELFISQLVHNVPGLRKLTKASERAYTVFLNKLRADVFDHTVETWKRTGTPSLRGLRSTGGAAPTQQDIDQLAKWVNWATGRAPGRVTSGDLGRTMSAAWFSPQFTFSRFLAPTLLATGSPAIRRQVARDLGIFLGTGMGLLTLMHHFGVADVEVNPKSADFGKVRVGNTRFDFWAGYQQIARYSWQAITNERKGAGGQIVGLNRAETLGKFFQSKLSPPVGLAVDVTRGETIVGDELDPTIDDFSEQAIARTLPFFLNDVHEALTHSGLAVAAPTFGATFFGVGAVSYSSTQDLLEEFGLDTAEPHERLAILAQNPELAQELVQRREISAERGSEAAQRSIGVEEIREFFGSQQSAADVMFATGQLTPGDWREQRKIISAAERNQLKSLFRDVEPGPETPLTRYFAVIDAATDEIGRTDFDEVDIWLEAQPAEDQRFIEDNTGLRDTELEQAYKSTLSDLDDTGFFDMRDNVWGVIARTANLGGFEDFSAWRRDVVNQIADVYVRQGVNRALAVEEAERRMNTHPIQKAYSAGINELQQRFMIQYPELAVDAVKWGLLNTRIEERQFLASAVR